MGEFWTMKNQKLIASLSIGVVAWKILSQAFTQIPKFPAMLSQPLMGNISVLTIAAVFALYAIYMLYQKF